MVHQALPRYHNLHLLPGTKPTGNIRERDALAPAEVHCAAATDSPATDRQEHITHAEQPGSRCRGLHAFYEDTTPRSTHSGTHLRAVQGLPEESMVPEAGVAAMATVACHKVLDHLRRDDVANIFCVSIL